MQKTTSASSTESDESLWNANHYSKPLIQASAFNASHIYVNSTFLCALSRQNSECNFGKEKLAQQNCKFFVVM